MSDPSSFTLPRYLEAKRSVDARALNRRVWTQFLEALPNRESLRILEVGAGVGATCERILSALGEEKGHTLDYTLLDKSEAALDRAGRALTDSLQERGFGLAEDAPQVWSDDTRTVTLRYVAEDLFAFAGRYEGPRFDAVVGQALFDLLTIPDALRRLRPHLREGGLWYLPIHFDGVTAFEPSLDPPLDAQIEALYHESMSDPEGRNGAKSGRRLLRHLHGARETLLAAGGSDWVVFAGEDGYDQDEAYFLEQILRFIEDELTGHPELDKQEFLTWLSRRRQQIVDGELIYVAHQLDVLAKIPEREGSSGQPSKSGASST